jgi:hypothetical protein
MGKWSNLVALIITSIGLRPKKGDVIPRNINPIQPHLYPIHTLCEIGRSKKKPIFNPFCPLVRIKALKSSIISHLNMLFRSTNNQTHTTTPITLSLYHSEISTNNFLYILQGRGHPLPKIQPDQVNIGGIH